MNNIQSFLAFYAHITLKTTLYKKGENNDLLLINDLCIIECLNMQHKL